MTIDLLVLHAGQLATCASPLGPKRKAALSDVGLLADGAVAIDDGLILETGPTAQLEARHKARETLDAGGRAVCPGFVDAHTHTIFGGDRVNEFELRIAGATYQQIMAAGGGILSTVRQTRAAGVPELEAQAKLWLDQMLALGSTTVEIKSGYGLSLDTELDMLEVTARLGREHVIDVIPTFLGAHTVPSEYRDRADAYVDVVVKQMLPAVARWYKKSPFLAQDTPLFCDVFCEEHAFNVPQARAILSAALALGLRAKIHVDQFTSLGGLAMAVALGAASADHLEVSTAEQIRLLAESDTVGVVLPAANFNLAVPDYADARGLIDAGAAVALATDFNPGSAPCLSMPLVMAIACRYQRLLPAEALNASTINAAHAVGLGNRLGSLEAGKQADMLVLKTGDYRHLAYYVGGNPVATVVKRGVVQCGRPLT